MKNGAKLWCINQVLLRGGRQLLTEFRTALQKNVNIIEKKRQRNEWYLKVNKGLKQETF